jgi:hypothetical protein
MVKHTILTLRRRKTPLTLVVFIVLVCKSYSQKPQEALNLLVTVEHHATVYVFTQFAECTGTDCK